MKLEKSAPAPTLRTLDERRDERRRRRRILLYSPAFLKHQRNSRFLLPFQRWRSSSAGETDAPARKGAEFCLIPQRRRS